MKSAMCILIITVLALGFYGTQGQVQGISHLATPSSEKTRILYCTYNITIIIRGAIPFYYTRIMCTLRLEMMAVCIIVLIRNDQTITILRGNYRVALMPLYW